MMSPMLNIIKYSLTLLLTLVMIQFINAQQDEYITRVKLKDGSVLEGKLTEYVDGEYIKMNLGENQITINQSSIKSIKHTNLSAGRKYEFKEVGLYNHTSVGFLSGFISAGNPVLGIGIDHSTGYLFNKYAGAGLNFSVLNYDPGYREVFYTLSAEFRGYIFSQKLSPYYLVRSGYGFAHGGESFLEADGGFYMNPAIGFRFTGKKSANFTAEIGLNFQNAHFKQQTDWWDRSILEKDVRYQRFNIKIGILF